MKYTVYKQPAIVIESVVIMQFSRSSILPTGINYV